MTTTQSSKPLSLTAKTAEDLMTGNPISIEADANIQEAVALFTDRLFHVAPVIDVSGRPVGVISTIDLLVHLRECPLNAPLEDQEEKQTSSSRRAGFSVEVVDPTTVRDVMTPELVTVQVDDSTHRVVELMKQSGLHHLFVTDEQGTLVGVISSGDIVGHLHVVH